jgi:DNA-directed RNA polymerase subunit M/transcription elongation factor TFIIS
MADYNNQRRELIKSLYNNVFSKFGDFDKSDNDNLQELIRRLERACWNSAIRKTTELGKVSSFGNPTFNALYSEENSRLLNLLEKSSIMRTIIKDPKISNNVCTMTSEQLAPDLFETIRQDLNIRQNQEIVIKTSKMYQCSKCKSRHTTFQKYQARAPDEDSAISYKCMVCQHTWRK